TAINMHVGALGGVVKRDIINTGIQAPKLNIAAGTVAAHVGLFVAQAVDHRKFAQHGQSLVYGDIATRVPTQGDYIRRKRTQRPAKVTGQPRAVAEVIDSTGQVTVAKNQPVIG